eukprot:4561216-Pleurochrysis_carterae.AAC.2
MTEVSLKSSPYAAMVGKQSVHLIPRTQMEQCNKPSRHAGYNSQIWLDLRCQSQGVGCVCAMHDKGLQLGKCFHYMLLGTLKVRD